MCSRTMFKQQLMRQKVMDEDRPKNVISNVGHGNFFSTHSDNYNNMSQNNDCLSSLTSTIVGPDKHYKYCQPFIDSPPHGNQYQEQSSDDFHALNGDYNQPSTNIDSSYILPNMYPPENRYSIPSMSTEFSLGSSNIDNNLDSNSYKAQFRNVSSRTSQMGQMHDIFGYETSYSCPIIGEQSVSNPNQSRISNSNSSIAGVISLNYEEKRTQLKDRSKKESHNRIERKRRDFINQQIMELSNLLPPQMMTEGESKKNKGNILKNSVLYIQHLQNEASNTLNYVRETDLAFMLIDSYRKQIQDLQQQFKSETPPKEVSSPPGCQSITENYNQYSMLHAQNRRTYQTNDQLLQQLNASSSSDMCNRYSVSTYNKSPLSSSENGSAFKVEPCSVLSFNGNDHLSSTYRIGEEADVGFGHLGDVLSSKGINQSSNLFLSSQRDDLTFNASNSRGIRCNPLESMEC